MLLPYIGLLTSSVFPETPLPEQVTRGAAVYARGKGLDRVLLEDRRVIGLWFDGAAHRDVEECIWLSPSLLSRWLGYLQAEEKWYPGELEKRWRQLHARLSGKLTFVVRVSSFPKFDLLEDDIVGTGDPAEVGRVEFLLTQGSFHLASSRSELERRLLPKRRGSESAGESVFPLWPVLLAKRRAAHWRALEDFAWHRELSIASELAPRFDLRPGSPALFTGRFLSAWYFVETGVPNGFDPKKKFSVRIFTPRRERIAEFGP